MAATECVREAEVLDLVVVGQWPERAEPALREHVAGCRVCSDLAEAASSIAELADGPDADVRVPDASLVWRRAALDAYRDRTRRATAPMAFAQVAAAVAVAGLVWAFRTDVLTLAAQAWGVLATSVTTARPADVAAEWSASPALRWSIAGAAASAAVVLLAWSLISLADRGVDGESGHHSRP